MLRPTARQLEIIELIADGLGNREIAARLGITAKTVSVHIEDLKHRCFPAGLKARRLVIECLRVMGRLKE